jgi:hypothetical protein
MAIDIKTETLVPLKEAFKHFPQRPSKPTIWRFWRRGSHGVLLETVCLGSRRFTSTEAIDRFTEAVTAARGGEPVERRVTPRQRQRSIDAAHRRLEAAGIH